MKRHWLICFCIVVLSSGCSRAAVLKEKTIKLDKLGEMTLVYPEGWKDELIQIQEGTTNLQMTFDAIKFEPTNGSNFAFLIQMIPVGEQRVATFGIKSQLMQSGRVELSNAVEASLDIREFKGTNTTGAYFRVTDRRWTNSTPPAPEFKALTQGFAGLGPLILSFRLVSNDPVRDEPAALAVIKSARFTKPAPAK